MYLFNYYFLFRSALLLARTVPCHHHRPVSPSPPMSPSPYVCYYVTKTFHYNCRWRLWWPSTRAIYSVGREKITQFMTDGCTCGRACVSRFSEMHVTDSRRDCFELTMDRCMPSWRRVETTRKRGALWCTSIAVYKSVPMSSSFTELVRIITSLVIHSTYNANYMELLRTVIQQYIQQNYFTQSCYVHVQ